MLCKRSNLASELKDFGVGFFETSGAKSNQDLQMRPTDGA
jgi:hypothetical protein